jgi:hypothetical protein
MKEIVCAIITGLSIVGGLYIHSKVISQNLAKSRLNVNFDDALYVHGVDFPTSMKISVSGGPYISPIYVDQR